MHNVLIPRYYRYMKDYVNCLWLFDARDAIWYILHQDYNTEYTSFIPEV